MWQNKKSAAVLLGTRHCDCVTRFCIGQQQRTVKSGVNSAHFVRVHTHTTDCRGSRLSPRTAAGRTAQTPPLLAPRVGVNVWWTGLCSLVQTWSLLPGFRCGPENHRGKTGLGRTRWCTARPGRDPSGRTGNGNSTWGWGYRLLRGLCNTGSPGWPHSTGYSSHWVYSLLAPLLHWLAP